MFLTQGGKELEREYSKQAVKDLIVCVHLMAKDNEKLYLPLLTHARFKLDMHIQMINIKNNLENKLGSPGGLIKDVVGLGSMITEFQFFNTEGLFYIARLLFHDLRVDIDLQPLYFKY